MKKNTIMRIAAVVLMCTLVTACFASSTFAKYTSQATGTDTARVAKWEILETTDANNKVTLTTKTPQTLTFNLFDTILDSDGSDESDVAKVTGSKIIAPGTTGKFDFTLTNKSEVTAKYKIVLKLAEATSIPIEVKIGGNWVKLTTNEVALTTDYVNLEMGATDVKTDAIEWRWVYENGTGDTLTANDKIDTDLGIDGTATVKVQATILLEQVD